MTRRAIAASLCLLALACGTPDEPVAPAAATKSTAPVPKYTTDPEPDYDTDNLLNLTYGAAVISRTAEFTLENSAIHAIDSSVMTAWSSPAGSPSQTLTFSLLAPARLNRLGITTTEAVSSAPTSVLFEVSSDGQRWREALKLLPKGSDDPQLSDIRPIEAQYLRVTTTGTDTILLRSIHAIGTELRPPLVPVVGGCWKINEAMAQFVQSGASITGVIATDPPTLLDGGTDGRVGLFMWTQGPMWGYAAISVTPDEKTLSGLKIHEEISTQQYGDGWFGERIPCGTPALVAPAPASLRPRAPEGRWSAFGIVFDPQDRLLVQPGSTALDALAHRIAAEPSQRFRVVAHELRSSDAAENRKRTDSRIESLRQALKSRGTDLTRVEFVSAGSDWTEPPIRTALQRLMASRVDLERFGR